MIQSTLSEQNKLFWCQGRWKNQAQWFFWWNEAEKVIEATEVVEAAEVTEAAEVLRSRKSLLRTLESSRFLNSALFWWFEKNIDLGRFLKYHIEIYHLFCQRLLRPADVTFFENLWVKLKCPLLLKPLATIVQENFQSFYPSEPFTLARFKMRHPVPW